MAASESNVPEGFDDVDKLSYEQTSGSWLRLPAEDASAFGQHRKFPPHARKISGTQGISARKSEQMRNF